MGGISQKLPPKKFPNFGGKLAFPQKCPKNYSQAQEAARVQREEREADLKFVADVEFLSLKDHRVNLGGNMRVVGFRAGFGILGDFLTADREEFRTILQVARPQTRGFWHPEGQKCRFHGQPRRDLEPRKVVR